MGAVLTIAKRDLKAYFATPKAGAIFAFFIFIMGLFFQSFVYLFMEYQQRAPQFGGKGPTLDQMLAAFFNNFHFVNILLVPALTMAAFSEERKTMTIRLLQTSPVSPLQIVLGKFCSAVGLLILVMIASSVFPLFLVKYAEPDLGLILSSYLGIFLLFCAQLAFGIWISSMTKNQFMAFLFTMLGMFLLLIINWVTSNTVKDSILGAVFQYISTTNHLENMFKGLITVSDVTYFILLSGLFLFFTNVVLDSQRWR